MLGSRCARRATRLTETLRGGVAFLKNVFTKFWLNWFNRFAYFGMTQFSNFIVIRYVGNGNMTVKNHKDLFLLNKRCYIKHGPLLLIIARSFIPFQTLRLNSILSSDGKYKSTTPKAQQRWVETTDVRDKSVRDECLVRINPLEPSSIGCGEILSSPKFCEFLSQTENWKNCFWSIEIALLTFPFLVKNMQIMELLRMAHTESNPIQTYQGNIFYICCMSIISRFQLLTLFSILEYNCTS